MWPFSKSQPVAASGILYENDRLPLPHIARGRRWREDNERVTSDSCGDETPRSPQSVVYSPYHGGYTQYQRRAERTISRIEREIRKPEDAYCGTVELNLAAEYMMDNLFCGASGGRRSASDLRRRLPVSAG